MALSQRFAGRKEIAVIYETHVRVSTHPLAGRIPRGALGCVPTRAGGSAPRGDTAGRLHQASARAPCSYPKCEGRGLVAPPSEHRGGWTRAAQPQSSRSLSIIVTTNEG